QNTTFRKCTTWIYRQNRNFKSFIDQQLTESFYKSTFPNTRHTCNSYSLRLTCQRQKSLNQIMCLFLMFRQRTFCQSDGLTQGNSIPIFYAFFQLIDITTLGFHSNKDNG